MRVLILLVGVGWAADAAAAHDFEDNAFGLRLQAALTRFSRFADVAGTGGASVASKWASSINPASVAWQPMRGVSPQYAWLAFDEGTSLHVFTASAALPTERSGTFQPSLAAVASNHATTRDGLTFGWEGVFGDVSWGLRPEGSRSAFGVNLNAAYSEIELDLGPLRVSDSRSKTFGIRLGGLWEFVDRFFGGVILDYAAVVSDTWALDPATGGQLTSDDTLHQFLARPGLSYKVGRWTLYADYEFGLFNDSSGTLRVHRFYLGPNWEVTDAFSLRAGTVIDDRGNVGATFGIGVFPSERWSIELAYQYDMFPEVRAEFGRSHALVVSATILF
jgi:hypothetical protein